MDFINPKIEREIRVLNKVVDKLLGQMLEGDIINRDDFPWNRFVTDRYVDKMKNYCKNRRGVSYRWCLLTVNPIKEIGEEELLKKSLKCAKKCWIKHAEWCLEWRNEAEGLHMHMAIEIEAMKKPSEMRRECYNTFKNLVGNPQHVNMKFSNQCPFNNYVKGTKDGKPKDNAINDIKNREILDIPHTLEWGESPTSKGAL